MVDFRNKIKLATKLAIEYKDVQILPPILQSQQAGPAGPKRPTQSSIAASATAGPNIKLIGGPEADKALVPTYRYLFLAAHILIPQQVLVNSSSRCRASLIGEVQTSRRICR